jgi:hypothetical protein
MTISKTKLKVPLKPKPKGQRPRCLHCEKQLEPQFTQAVMPAQLKDGRRRVERETWEKSHPAQFTGYYGRFSDNCFCGVTCGYNWAISRAAVRRHLISAP